MIGVALVLAKICLADGSSLRMRSIRYDIPFVLCTIVFVVHRGHMIFHSVECNYHCGANGIFHGAECDYYCACHPTMCGMDFNVVSTHNKHSRKKKTTETRETYAQSLTLF